MRRPAVEKPERPQDGERLGSAPFGDGEDRQLLAGQRCEHER